LNPASQFLVKTGGRHDQSCAGISHRARAAASFRRADANLSGHSDSPLILVVGEPKIKKTLPAIRRSATCSMILCLKKCRPPATLFAPCSVFKATLFPLVHSGHPPRVMNGGSSLRMSCMTGGSLTHFVDPMSSGQVRRGATPRRGGLQWATERSRMAKRKALPRAGSVLLAAANVAHVR